MQMPFNHLVSDVFCIRKPYYHADLNAIALLGMALLAEKAPIVWYDSAQQASYGLSSFAYIISLNCTALKRKNLCFGLLGGHKNKNS
jgi:hypothetical protein